MFPLSYITISLVAFGLGVFLAAQIWGKYKQLAHSLTQRVSQAEAAALRLTRDLDRSREEIAEAEDTRRVLEHELGNIASERDEVNKRCERLLVDVSQKAAMVKRLERERLEEKDQRSQLEEAEVTLAAQLEQLGNLERAVQSAQNRQQMAENERRQAYKLITKLRAEVEKLAAMQATLEEKERTIAQLRRAHRRRAQSNPKRPAMDANSVFPPRQASPRHRAVMRRLEARSRRQRKAPEAKPSREIVMVAPISVVPEPERVPVTKVNGREIAKQLPWSEMASRVRQVAQRLTGHATGGSGIKEAP